MKRKRYWILAAGLLVLLLMGCYVGFAPGWWDGHGGYGWYEDGHSGGGHGGYGHGGSGYGHDGRHGGGGHGWNGDHHR